MLDHCVDCDVCVVGGGITGCSAALNLAERGFKVVLLEGQYIGFGGSGRSGGQLLYGFARDMSRIRALVPREEALILWNMSVEAVRIARERIARHAIQCDLVMGYMAAAIHARHRRALMAEHRQLQEEYGYKGLQVIEGDALHALLDTRRYIAGLYDPQSGHLHPLNYTLGLAAAAQASGTAIFEHSEAMHLELGARVAIRTARGEVRSRYLVLAGGAYQGELVPRLHRKIMPVGTYITATEPLGAVRAQSLIANNMAVCDMNFVLDYFRLSADHRLLFGGRVSYSTLQPCALAATLRARMLKVFPQLRDARQEFTWGGFVDITMNRAPHFGRLAPNVYFVHGFSGHGMALSGLAGQLIAEAIAGTAERFDVFARIRHRDFPGGRWLRTPLLVLAMTWFRLRDLL
jgi:gamma-glutamylputrescine oxidase